MNEQFNGGILMNVSLRNEKGFSLVELMVVVAIIGILAAIAVPNFQRFSAKAKQSEAKSNLSAIYGAEKAFIAEWQTYNGSYAVIGFKPSGLLKYRLTNAAFTGLPANYAGPAYAAADVTTLTYCGVNAIGGTSTTCGESITGTVGCAAPFTAAAMTINTFTASAGSLLNLGSPIDTWTVDNDKLVANTQNGLP